MAPPLSAVQVNGAAKKPATFTLSGLKTWSCTKNDLPSVDKIKSIHFYDFDNTLFSTPVPNPQLWRHSGPGTLMSQDSFVNGGWWHDPNVLALTGKGIEQEEPRGWAGWWNEQIVELVKLSMQQQDALTVLCTGRLQTRFDKLIQRMVKSRNLEFDMICLKPAKDAPNGRPSTMLYKQALLEALLKTYSDADEIRIYEDRVKHVRDFRSYLSTFNAAYQPNRQLPTATGRTKPVQAEVIEVATKQTTLDPLVEATQVQRMVNEHNTTVRASSSSSKIPTWTLTRSLIFLGYMIQPHDTTRLLALANLPAPTRQQRIHTIANAVLIDTHYNAKAIDRSGGIGAKVTWRAIALGTAGRDANTVWAARCQPVPITTPFYVETNVPYVVLACRERARPVDAQEITNWVDLQPRFQFEFETIVGEKVLLKLESSKSVVNDHGKRPRQSQGDEFPALPKPGQSQQQGGGSGSGGGDRRGGGANTGGQGGGQRGGGGARAGRGGGAGRGGFRGGGGGGGGGGQSRGGPNGISQRNLRGADGTAGGGGAGAHANGGGGGGARGGRGGNHHGGGGGGGGGGYKSLDHQETSNNARAARSFGGGGGGGGGGGEMGGLDGAADDGGGGVGLSY